MLHRIEGRASYFSPDIFIERCKDTKKVYILDIFLRFLIKNPHLPIVSGEMLWLK